MQTAHCCTMRCFKNICLICHYKRYEAALKPGALNTAKDSCSFYMAAWMQCKISAIVQEMKTILKGHIQTKAPCKWSPASTFPPIQLVQIHTPASSQCIPLETRHACVICCTPCPCQTVLQGGNTDTTSSCLDNTLLPIPQALCIFLPFQLVIFILCPLYYKVAHVLLLLLCNLQSIWVPHSTLLTKRECKYLGQSLVHITRLQLL